MIAKHVRTVATLLALGLCVSDAGDAAAGAPAGAPAAAGSPDKWKNDGRDPSRGLTHGRLAETNICNVDWAATGRSIQFKPRQMQWDEVWINKLLRDYPNKNYPNITSLLELVRESSGEVFMHYWKGIYKPAMDEWATHFPKETYWKFYRLLALKHYRCWPKYEVGKVMESNSHASLQSISYENALNSDIDPILKVMQNGGSLPAIKTKKGDTIESISDDEAAYLQKKLAYLKECMVENLCLVCGTNKVREFNGFFGFRRDKKCISTRCCGECAKNNGNKHSDNCVKHNKVKCTARGGACKHLAREFHDTLGPICCKDCADGKESHKSGCKPPTPTVPAHSEV